MLRNSETESRKTDRSAVLLGLSMLSSGYSRTTSMEARVSTRRDRRVLIFLPKKPESWLTAERRKGRLREEMMSLTDSA